MARYRQGIYVRLTGGAVVQVRAILSDSGWRRPSIYRVRDPQGVETSVDDEGIQAISNVSEFHRAHLTHLGTRHAAVVSANDNARLPGASLYKEVRESAVGAAESAIAHLRRRLTANAEADVPIWEKITALEGLAREKLAALGARLDDLRPRGVGEPSPFGNLQHYMPFGEYAETRLTRLIDGTYCTVAGGVETVANGTFQFVIRADHPAEVFVGQGGHHVIAQATSAHYAGQLYFRAGVLLYWDNDTGHYRTHPGYAAQAGVPRGADGRPLLSVETFRPIHVRNLRREKVRKLLGDHGSVAGLATALGSTELEAATLLDDLGIHH